jgi:hypothetical protein
MPKSFAVLFVTLFTATPCFAQGGAFNSQVPRAAAESDQPRHFLDDENEAPEFPLPVPGPAETLYGIYQPWMGALRDLKAQLRSDQNYVIWIMVPPQHPMDLRSADRFRRWLLATPPQEMSISHNMVAWTCRLPNGQASEGATGMTGEGSDQTSKLVKRGYGLSAFHSVFTDGYLNPVWQVDSYVQANIPQRGAFFLAFAVSAEQCAAMNDFLRSFVMHPSEPFKRFGLTPRPNLMEGGGCVTFASELLKRAGILESVIPQFYRHLKARRDFFGGNLGAPPVQTEVPSPPWLEGKPHDVSRLTLMTRAWDLGSKEMITLSVMDPEKMIYVAKQFAELYLARLPERERASERNRLMVGPLGLRLTVGRVIGDLPSGTVIDDSFAGMREIRDSSRAWLRQKLAEGYSLRRGSILGMPVFVVD